MSLGAFRARALKVPALCSAWLSEFESATGSPKGLSHFPRAPLILWDLHLCLWCSIHVSWTVDNLGGAERFLYPNRRRSLLPSPMSQDFLRTWLSSSGSRDTALQIQAEVFRWLSPACRASLPGLATIQTPLDLRGRWCPHPPEAVPLWCRRITGTRLLYKEFSENSFKDAAAACALYCLL